MNQPKGAMSVYGYEKSSNEVNDEKDMNEIYKPYKKGVCVHTPATLFNFKCLGVRATAKYTIS